VRFAVLTWSLAPEAIESLCDRIRTPNEERELAVAASRCKAFLGAQTAERLLQLLKRGDAIRRRDRFEQLLQSSRLAQPDLQLDLVGKALDAAASVDAGAIAQQFPQDIPARLVAARRQAIARVL
jgi:hypothetical protein